MYPHSSRPGTRRRTLLAASVSAALGAGLFLAGGLALRPTHNPEPPQPAGRAAEAADSGDPLAAHITDLQQHLRKTPKDAEALAGLGLSYVQQAKNTVDPTYYPKAEAVLKKSLKLGKKDNYAAMGGMAALEAARHHFAQSLDWAKRAVAINPYNSSLYGILADAYTQLGRYQESFKAVQRMVDLEPGTPSLTRASYTWELRGDVDAARKNMQRALEDATSTAQKTFARYYLAELAFDNGHPHAALDQAEAGLRADPSSGQLLEAKAKAEAALGKTKAALADYRKAVNQVPQPQYVLELGELYQSLGHTKKAEEQYKVFRAEEKLFSSNGVALDSDATLFEADHGDPAKALAVGREGLRIRPFLEMQDAYAWALHVNGNDTEALTYSKKATALGMRNALFHYHQGMIQKSLGNTEAARSQLAQALDINPHFSPLHAPKARTALRELGGTPSSS